MAISFIESATGTSKYQTSVTVARPTGTSNGDLLIAFIGGTRSGGTPSGWTSLGSADSGTTSLGTCYVYYKIASSESSTYTFNFSGSKMACGVIAAYRGVDNSTPIGNYNVGGVGSGTNYDTSAITADGTQWAFTAAQAYEYGSSSTRSWSEGSGTEREDFGVTDSGGPDNCTAEITDSNGVVGSGSFTRSQTRSASASGGVKVALLINPDSAPAVTVNAGNAAITATAYDGVGKHTAVVGSGPDVSAGVSNAAALITWKAQAGVALVSAQSFIAKGKEAGSVSTAATAYNATVKVSPSAGVAAVSAASTDIAFTHDTNTRIVLVHLETRLTVVGYEDRTLAIQARPESVLTVMEDRVLVIGKELE